MSVNGIKYQECNACGDTVPAKSLRVVSRLLLMNTRVPCSTGGAVLCEVCRRAVEGAEECSGCHRVIPERDINEDGPPLCVECWNKADAADQWQGDDPHAHDGCSICIADGIGSSNPW